MIGDKKKGVKNKPLKNHYLGGKYENCCAYCKLHRRTMTVKQMRARQCREKQCRHFLKIITHPFWKYKVKEEKE